MRDDNSGAEAFGRDRSWAVHPNETYRGDRVPQKNQTLPPLVGSIVHPTDFSPASDRAFVHALAIALLRQTSLVLLHVGMEEHDTLHEFPQVRATLERWKLLKPGSAPQDVFAELGVRVSKQALMSRFPALALRSYLDESPADLLVVATEGREGVDRWLDGSVAEAMARWSKTMTLFVPDKAPRGFVSATDGSLHLANVLLPVDRSPDPGAAIEFARRVAQIASEGGATITLLHVGPESGMPHVAAADGDGWTFTRMVRDGDPVEQILAAAEEVEADLIVMPTAGRDGVFDVLRGSTTERVLRRAQCPLLAVPAPNKN
jgi:nucleotide-binding universal stress UspA family protein